MAVGGAQYTGGTISGKRYYLMYWNQYYRNKDIMNLTIKMSSITNKLLTLEHMYLD